MSGVVRILAVIGALAVAGAITSVILVVSMARHGFSARDEPSRMEALLAETLRNLSIPSEAKHRVNPVKITPQSLGDARTHFADHSAQCHANDGSGKSEMGQNMYPKPPDMRKRETQEKSDGELFYIVQNGVRLSGMPAWGEAKRDDEDSWKLVAFIRRLPSLTSEDLSEMERSNPKSADEWREEEEEREFLQGGVTPRPEKTDHHHHGGH